MTISRIKTPRTTKGKRQHPQVQRASYPDRPCRPFGKVFGSSRFFCGRSCRPAKRSLFFLQQQCGDRIQEAPHRVRSLTRSNYDHLHIVPGFEDSRVQKFPATEAPVFPSAGSVVGQPYQEGRAAEAQAPGRSEKDTTLKRGLLRNGRAVPGIPTEHPAPHGRIRHRKA